MSARTLPPLNALRAFEAAGRLSSFTKAAQELSVTPGAISRHVALLEDALGSVLFLREGRGAQLTVAGLAYLHDIQPSFQQIALATARQRRNEGRHVVRIDAPSSFAGLWLLPRLAVLHEAQPDIEVHLTTTNGAVDAGEHMFDLMVRGGPTSIAGVRTVPFLRNWRMPVCSPALMERSAITTPRDVRHATILYADSLISAWTDWLALAGCPDLVPTRALRFDRVHLAVRAAECGAGIALPSFALVEDALASGTLVMPFPDLTFPTRDYCAYLPSARSDRPGVAEVIEWLEAAGQASAARISA